MIAVLYEHNICINECIAVKLVETFLIEVVMLFILFLLVAGGCAASLHHPADEFPIFREKLAAVYAVLEKAKSPKYIADASGLTSFYHDSSKERAAMHSFIPDQCSDLAEQIDTVYLVLKFAGGKRAPVKTPASRPIYNEVFQKDAAETLTGLVQFYQECDPPYGILTVKVKQDVELDDAFFLYALKDRFVLPICVSQAVESSQTAHYLEYRIARDQKYKVLFQLHRNKHMLPAIKALKGSERIFSFLQLMWEDAGDDRCKKEKVKKLDVLSIIENPGSEKSFQLFAQFKLAFKNLAGDLEAIMYTVDPNYQKSWDSRVEERAEEQEKDDLYAELVRLSGGASL